MKAILRLWGILSIFLYCPLFSQITIEAPDIAAQFAVGTTQRTSSDTLTGSFDIGTPGGGNHWDFSNLVPHETVFPESVDPATTPFFDRFPGANVSIFGEAEIQGIKGDTYTYSILEDDFQTLGIAGQAMNNQLEAKIVNSFDPPQLTFDLPFTFGDAWTSQGTANIVSSINGIPLPFITSGYFISSEVDAFGTLIFPDGKSHEALRLKSILTLIVESSPGIQDTSVAVTFTFHTKSGEFLAVAAESANPPDFGIISGVATWTSNEITSIQHTDMPPAQFVLKPNYPNPFNPSTTIEYSIPRASFVELRVFDIIGKEVAILVKENQAAGSYRTTFDAGDLPSGIYIIRMRAEGFSQARKISLMK